MTTKSSRVVLVVLGMLGGLLAGTAPAQAIANYSQACQGYAHADSEPIREYAGGPVIGQVHAGVRTDVGRVCVATIKHRWADGSTPSRVIARIEVYTQAGSKLREAWDDETDYLYYAGDVCTYGPPEYAPGTQDCSTRHARDLDVKIRGIMSPPGRPDIRYEGAFWSDWATLVRQAG
jgi:hypothetical protein